ncbi:TetR/AcrR family transcriptional regulator [Candidatus Frankia nodulisporulans]|uniref:TetR/AcrR family transcriptional regulator n=1 Tax=Candidatus Frankia nodulisporulans TaxID=2060052 RepID=UPI0013D1C930|nr:TetR/AcrR family transcriptional regulator [Candidatus Frankia nodulisporulans]
MGRPKSPLVDRREAIVKALDIIDAEGLAALNLRRLGTELGVSGAALYHHFTDKDEILRGVVSMVLSQAVLPQDTTRSWEEILVESTTSFRHVLVSHPNAAPLLAPGSLPTSYSGNTAREHMVGRMLTSGVPDHLCYPIIESAEILAFGSALMNPNRLPVATRLHLDSPRATEPGAASGSDGGATTGVGPTGIDRTRNLRRVIEATGRSVDQTFDLQLAALMRGWKALIEQEARDQP